VKVALVLGTSAGGLGRHVRMLAAGCAARGVTVAVFGPARTGRDFGFEGLGPPGSPPVTFTPVEIADRPRVLRDLRAIARLRRLLRTAEPDVVHAHGLRAGALAAIAIAFGRTRTPLIVTVHNAPPAGGVTGAIYRVLELIVARNAASVLCVSADLEERMRAAGARRVARAVVPAPFVSLTASPAAPAPAPAPLTATPGDASAETPHAIAPAVSAETRAAVRGEFGTGPVVLTVGRLAAQKGFGVLLDAAAGWRDLRPEPSLVIVGEGPLEAELKQRAASLGVPATFTGRRPDVPALLAVADVFVLPSAWEGQALILQEALRAGVPIVATRVGGNPDLLGEDAALLVPPGDAQGLAGAVRSVLADPGLAARLRRAALDRATALPAEDDAVAAALAEYGQVARRQPLPGQPVSSQRRSRASRPSSVSVPYRRSRATPPSGKMFSRT
jgi:glycosyltransferase involved in cell wall biosynthesis